MVVRAANSFMDRTVTGRYFGTGDGTRTVWNLACGTSDRALLHPVLYKIDWGGIQQLYSIARTNLCLRSQTFNTGWNVATFPCSVSAVDTVVAPDGTTTADTVLATAGAAQHGILQAIAVSAIQYTLSVYLKKGTHQYISIGDAGDAPWHTVNIDMNTGAVTNQFGATGTSTSVGNGWYRLTCTFTRTNATNFNGGIAFVNSPTAAGMDSFTAAGTETVIVWGAQFETGPVATSYIPTTTAAASATDYSTDTAGKVTFASAPAATVQLMWKDPFASNCYRHFGVGDGTSVDFSLPFAPATPLIYRRGWAGNELLYATARTNLVIQSQDFSTGWTLDKLNAFGAGSILNAITAPDGTTTAEYLQVNTALGTHGPYRTHSVTSGTVYTHSLYVKSGELSKVRLVPQATAALATVQFDLQAVTSTLVSGTIVSKSIESIGNGWYRISVTVTATATGSGYFQLNLVKNDGSDPWTGDGTSGIYAWGAQVETGSVATPYIPTTTTAVTVTDYALDSAGRGDVTFAPAPAVGSVLTGTFNMGAKP